MEIVKLSAKSIREKVLNKEITCEEVVKAFIEQIEKNKEYNAILEVYSDAVDYAKEIDKQISAGAKGKLAGVPVIVKDNILVEGKTGSCGSKLLKHFVPHYSATVVKKIQSEGAIIIARANMDEFAVGVTTENSSFGATHNSLNKDRVADGSACAVALNMCPVALAGEMASASFSGIYGFKPSYGRVSRFGTVGYTSSLDQVGIYSKSVEDIALMLEVIAGADGSDVITEKIAVEEYSKDLNFNVKDITVGVPFEVVEMMKGMECEENTNQFIALLKENNIKTVDVSIKDAKLSMPTYYTISSAEVASNLARYDGVKYTTRSEKAKNLEEIYVFSRTEGFNADTKRRIMFGNLVISTGHYDLYYRKAKSIQDNITTQMEEALDKCDFIVLPTTIGEAYEIGKKEKDFMSAYKEEMFTILTNLTGVCGITIPFGKGKNGLPLGVQIVSKKFNEANVLKFAKYLEGVLGK